MFKTFGIMISTLVGLLAALSSGVKTPVQSADLSVQFGNQNLQDQPAISENYKISVEDGTPTSQRQAPSFPSADLSVQFGKQNLQDQPAISENSTISLEDPTPPPQRQAPSFPCPACGMG